MVGRPASQLRARWATGLALGLLAACVAPSNEAAPTPAPSPPTASVTGSPRPQGTGSPAAPAPVRGGAPIFQVERVASSYPVATARTGGRFRTGQAADLMLSGFDFDRAGGALTFNHPAGIASDGRRLFLADTFNNRVLIWNDAPTANTPPDLVLGQPDFESNRPGTSAHEMNWPMSVATDGARLLVADTYNDRILVWDRIPDRSGAAADRIVGSPSPRHGQSGQIAWPWGVWTDGTRLVVSSTGGSEVLVWDKLPVRGDEPPDLVLSAGKLMGTPRQVTSDGRSLIVGDHNARLPGTSTVAFVWTSFPRDDRSADVILTGRPWPRGTFGPDGRLWLMADTLTAWRWPIARPDESPELALTTSPCAAGDYEGLAFVKGRLYASCGNDNKVVVFDPIPARASDRPAFAIGAPDLATNTLHTRYVVQNGVPATDGKSLFVSSDFDRSLYVWLSLPDRSGAFPDLVYTFADFGPWDIALAGDRLALAGQQTVYVWTSLARVRAGQGPDVVYRGMVGNVQIGELRGIALDDRHLYLADERAGAVYVWDGLPAPNAAPTAVLRMSEPRRLDSDGRYLVVARALAQSVDVYRVSDLARGARAGTVGGVGRVNLPEGATVSDGRLIVADTAFDRVLVWNDVERAIAGAWPPDAVLGQPDERSTAAAIGRDRLFFPGGVAARDGFIWVAEFKFSNRLVRFSAAP